MGMVWEGGPMSLGVFGELQDRDILNPGFKKSRHFSGGMSWPKHPKDKSPRSWYTWSFHVAFDMYLQVNEFFTPKIDVDFPTNIFDTKKKTESFHGRMWWNPKGHSGSSVRDLLKFGVFGWQFSGAKVTSIWVIKRSRLEEAGSNIWVLFWGYYTVGQCNPWGMEKNSKEIYIYNSTPYKAGGRTDREKNKVVFNTNNNMHFTWITT